MAPMLSIQLVESWFKSPNQTVMWLSVCVHCPYMRVQRREVWIWNILKPFLWFTYTIEMAPSSHWMPPLPLLLKIQSGGQLLCWNIMYGYLQEPLAAMDISRYLHSVGLFQQLVQHQWRKATLIITHQSMSLSLRTTLWLNFSGAQKKQQLKLLRNM